MTLPKAKSRAAHCKCAAGQKKSLKRYRVDGGYGLSAPRFECAKVKSGCALQARSLTFFAGKEKIFKVRKNSKPEKYVDSEKIQS